IDSILRRPEKPGLLVNGCIDFSYRYNEEDDSCFNASSLAHLVSYTSAANESLMARVVPMEEQALPASTDEIAKGFFHNLRAHAVPVNRLKTKFPFWDCARDSIDYSLATYQYWVMLFQTCALWHSGMRLDILGQPIQTQQATPRATARRRRGSAS